MVSLIVGLVLGVAIGRNTKEAPSNAVDLVPDTTVSAPVTDVSITDDTTADTTPATTEGTTPDTTAPSSGSSTEIDGAPSGAVGSHSTPVAAGKIADLGDGWRLQVLGVVDDGTSLVLDENQFNDPPAPGQRFTLVTVALGYFGLDDPQSGFGTGISAVGAANKELSTDCGVIPSELNRYSLFFAGGVVVGNVCFVTAADDAPALQLYANSGFFGDDVFLEAKAPAGLVAMTAVKGPQDRSASGPLRQKPNPLGTSVDIGDDWSMVVNSPVRDLTDAVMNSNQFNSPPPPGFRFVGFDAAFAFNGSGSSNLLSVTVQAVSDSNVELSTSCGVLDGEIDEFADVFAGGLVAGTVCFVVPEGEVGSIVALAYGGFDSDRRVYFAVS